MIAGKVILGQVSHAFFSVILRVGDSIPSDPSKITYLTNRSLFWFEICRCSKNCIFSLPSVAFHLFHCHYTDPGSFWIHLGCPNRTEESGLLLERVDHWSGKHGGFVTDQETGQPMALCKKPMDSILSIRAYSISAISNKPSKHTFHHHHSFSLN